MIIYNRERKKGFRGFKYTAKAYIDSLGNDIDDKTPEGVEMVEIVCDVMSNDSQEVVMKSLREQINNKIKEYKPIWKM